MFIGFVFLFLYFLSSGEDVEGVVVRLGLVNFLLINWVFGNVVEFELNCCDSLGGLFIMLSDE